MVHKVRGLTAPLANQNIVNLYGEVDLTAPDTEKWLAPINLTVPNFPSDTGELIQVQSTSAGDAGYIKVDGLDEDFLPREEVIALTGTTPVISTKIFTRTNTLTWLGTSAFAGMITFTNIGATTVYRSMSPEAQISLDSVFTVPADKEWLVDSIYTALTRDSNNTAVGIIVVYYRPIGYAFRRPFKFPVASRGNSSNNYVNSTPEAGPAPADIYLAAEASDASGGTPTQIVARFTMRAVQ